MTEAYWQDILVALRQIIRATDLHSKRVMKACGLTIPQVILTESFLSFLGLGVQEPLTSWGVLISEGAKVIEASTWMLIYPALFLALTLFCFNFIGDGLRDALDPKDR